MRAERSVQVTVVFESQDEIDGIKDFLGVTSLSSRAGLLMEQGYSRERAEVLARMGERLYLMLRVPDE